MLGKCRGNEFQQGFRKVGRDVGIGERRPECCGVRGLRQVAVRVDSQGLFLYALESTGENTAIPCCECAEALFEFIVSLVTPFYHKRAPIAPVIYATAETGV